MCRTVEHVSLGDGASLGLWRLLHLGYDFAVGKGLAKFLAARLRDVRSCDMECLKGFEIEEMGDSVITYGRSTEVEKLKAGQTLQVGKPCIGDLGII